MMMRVASLRLGRRILLLEEGRVRWSGRLLHALGRVCLSVSSEAVDREGQAGMRTRASLTERRHGDKPTSDPKKKGNKQHNHDQSTIW